MADARASVKSFQFNGTLNELLYTYSCLSVVGKSIIKDPGIEGDLGKTVVFSSPPGQDLDENDKKTLIETLLEMYGVHLEPAGEKFIRAVSRKTARKEGIPLNLDNQSFKDSGTVVSTIIRFKVISAEVGEKILKEFLSDKSGPMQVFKHTNAILVTDTMQNINRMREILKEIDQKLPAMKPGGEWYAYVLKHATAINIEKALQSAYEYDKKRVEEMNKALEKPETSAGSSSQGAKSPSLFPRSQLGLGKTPAQAPVTTANSVVAGSSPFFEGMLPTPPLFIYDDENAPNKLIVYTTPEEKKIYDKIVEQLDVPSVPDKVIKVYRLKYAEAEEVSNMINDLINKSAGSRSSKSDKKAQDGAKPAQQQARPATKQPVGESRVGELTPENTQVLADKRINGLVVQTLRSLVPTIEAIKDSMDIKLSQVLIETVIIEVGLGDTIKTGLDWARGINKGSVAQGIGGGGGNASMGQVSNTVGKIVVDSAMETVKNVFIPGSSGLNYAIASEKLDLAAVISLSKSDANSKYLASPVIMTVDNKEAEIKATEMRYLFKGYTYSGNTYSGSAVPDYEQKEIGITIKTTPKINPNGTVMLKVEEEYSQEGSGQEIEGQNSKKFNAATTVTRKMSSDVVLENGQTVILGGLVSTYKSSSETGIPILKDIPLVGRYLFGKTEDSETRAELVVFMTPYVLNDAEAAQAEALRRKKALADAHAWEDHGWSSSSLADPISQKEHLRRLKQEWKKQDEERKTRQAIEDEKIERVKKLKEMSEEEREKWLKMHKETLEEEQQEELEKKMLDKKSQEGLKKLVEQVRTKKLAVTEAELAQAAKETAALNERAKMDAAKEKTGGRAEVLKLIDQLSEERKSQSNE